VLNQADNAPSAGERGVAVNSMRKPMLYPLSYEGLRCTFAQHVERVLVRRARTGCLAQTVCAAPVPRAVNQLIHHRPDTRRRLYGGWCRAKSRRPSNEVMRWLVLAVVMLVGSMGCELVALFVGKIADGEKPDFS